MDKLIYISIICILLIGCSISKTKQVNETKDNNIIVAPKTPTEKLECSLDSDCVRGGCSGTSCYPKSEQIFTTCEYLPEYECYKLINCGCVNNKCQWEKTEEFEGCFGKK
ncbi:MAG: eight-cysteine-cluster domain-containing protein [Nanoarchaeota archaeon]